MTNSEKYAIINIENEREVKPMRALTYKLNDGTVVKTMAEAKAGGQRYTAQMKDIPRPLHVAPKQREMLDKGLCPIVGIQ